MTRVGIIGCGNIARFHYEGYARAGAEIAHVCDLHVDAAEAVAQQYSARVSADYRAVLDDPAVDLVSVTSSSSSHKEICLAAIPRARASYARRRLPRTPRTRPTSPAPRTVPARSSRLRT